MSAPTSAPPSDHARRGAGARRTWRRSLALARLAAVRARLRVLGVVAPAAADRLAVDLWSTVPEPRVRRDYRTSAGVVQQLPMPHGGTVAAEVWGQGPVVHLVHGWGGWRGQLGAFVAPLVAAGYRVVAVDAPSHGDSAPGVMGPHHSSVMEMIEALEAADRELGPAVGIIAHSLGCTVAGQVITAGRPVERLVLVAPNPSFHDLLEEYARLLRLPRRIASHLEAELEAIAHRPLATFDLVGLPAEHPLPATLVVHDRADKETPYRVGARLADTWPGARLVSTQGLGHQQVLADRTVVQEAVDHLTGGAASAEHGPGHDGE